MKFLILSSFLLVLSACGLEIEEVQTPEEVYELSRADILSDRSSIENAYGIDLNYSPSFNSDNYRQSQRRRLKMMDSSSLENLQIKLKSFEKTASDTLDKISNGEAEAPVDEQYNINDLKNNAQDFYNVIENIISDREALDREKAREANLLFLNVLDEAADLEKNFKINLPNPIFGSNEDSFEAHYLPLLNVSEKLNALKSLELVNDSVETLISKHDVDSMDSIIYSERLLVKISEATEEYARLITNSMN